MVCAPSTVSDDDAVEPGVGGALPQVAVAGALEVPARASARAPAPRRAARARPAASEEGRHRRRDHRRHGDEDRRDAEPDDVRERLDVVGRARHEVAGAGPLDGRQRQAHRAGDELLAQLGEDPSRPGRTRPAGRPRSARSARRWPATSRAMSRSMRPRLRSPVVTSCTTWPMTHGPTRAASAATACQPSTFDSGPRWSRSSTAVWARTVALEAIGRVRAAWSVRPSSGDITHHLGARCRGRRGATAAGRGAARWRSPGRPRRARRCRRGRAAAGSR